MLDTMIMRKSREYQKFIFEYYLDAELKDCPSWNNPRRNNQ